MKKITLLLVAIFALQGAYADKFSDGTPISKWFKNKEIPTLEELGKAYDITEHGVVNDSTIMQTKALQKVIDKVASAGGGVVVIPEGCFLTGSIFFKPGVHLHLLKGAKLKGSDNIGDFPPRMTRMEGQTIKYFPALINVDKVDGFTLTGEGTIDGSGKRFWTSFWIRRSVIPDCTNIDELRPRILFVSNSNDVLVANVRIQNSPYWTTHYYKCKRVRCLNLHITSPKGAPSTDAIDIDVCTDFLVSDCYMSVNDDAIVMKGGKGPKSDKDPNNGGNKNVIIENCTFGFCHAVLTCGSESIHNRNIILRNCTVDKSGPILKLKMRPDTPQLYEHIEVYNITGNAASVLHVHPWLQFYDLKGETTQPLSYGQNITMSNIKVKCPKVLDIKESDQYILSDFTFKGFEVEEEAKKLIK